LLPFSPSPPPVCFFAYTNAKNRLKRLSFLASPSVGLKAGACAAGSPSWSYDRRR
jgi:hypothetical protein